MILLHFYNENTVTDTANIFFICSSLKNFVFVCSAVVSPLVRVIVEKCKNNLNNLKYMIILYYYKMQDQFSAAVAVKNTPLRLIRGM